MINGGSACYPDTNIGIVPPLWRDQSLQGQTKTIKIQEFLLTLHPYTPYDEIDNFLAAGQ